MLVVVRQEVFAASVWISGCECGGGFWVVLAGGEVGGM